LQRGDSIAMTCVSLAAAHASPQIARAANAAVATTANRSDVVEWPVIG